MADYSKEEKEYYDGPYKNADSAGNAQQIGHRSHRHLGETGSAKEDAGGAMHLTPGNHGQIAIDMNVGQNAAAAAEAHSHHGDVDHFMSNVPTHLISSCPAEPVRPRQFRMLLM